MGWEGENGLHGLAVQDMGLGWRDRSIYNVIKSGDPGLSPGATQEQEAKEVETLGQGLQREQEQAAARIPGKRDLSEGCGWHRHVMMWRVRQDQGPGLTMT